MIVEYYFRLNVFLSYLCLKNKTNFLKDNHCESLNVLRVHQITVH